MGYDALEEKELASVGAGGNDGGVLGGIGSTSVGGAGGGSGDAGEGGAGGSETVSATITDGAGGSASSGGTAGDGTGGSTGTGGSADTGGSAGTGGSASASADTSSSTAAGTSTGGSAGTGAGGLGGAGASTMTSATTGATTGVAGGPGVGEEPYCLRLHHLGATPVIDGELDGQLPLQDLRKDTARIPFDNPPEFASLPSDVSMRFAAAWFDGGLYVFAEIVDPDRYPALASNDEWTGDGIDLYVDHDAVFGIPGFYDDPGTRSLSVSAPVDGSTPSTRGGIFKPFVDLGTWPGGECTAVPTADGYRVEAVVTAATLALASWSPSPSAPFAFDLGHNVSFPAGQTGSEGRRLGHYFARVAEGADGDFEDYPFYNSAVFCVPILVDP